MGVEAGHDPKLAPPLKELPQPAGRDAPAGGPPPGRPSREAEQSPAHGGSAIRCDGR
jgi:hypothetical protein